MDMLIDARSKLPVGFLGRECGCQEWVLFRV